MRALFDHYTLLDAASAEDRDLRRHDDETGETSGDHAEIRQRDRGAAQLLGRDRPRRCVGTHAIEASAQIRAVTFADIAQDGNNKAAFKIDGDADIDAA